MCEEDKLLANRFIGVSEDFLKKLPAISTREAKLLLYPLYNIKYTSHWNDLEVEISKNEIRKLFNLSKTYNSNKAFNSYIIDLIEDVARIEIDGIRIFENIYYDNNWLYIKYDERLRNCFEGLGKEKRYFKIYAEDLANISKRYSFNFYKSLLLSNNGNPGCEFSRSTRRLKQALGLKEDDYMRESGGFDRYNFEKYVLTETLEDINKGKQISIKNIKNKLYYKTYFDEENDYERNPVKEYRVVFTVNSMRKTKEANNEE